MGISRRAFEISKKLVLVVGFLVLALPAACSSGTVSENVDGSSTVNLILPQSSGSRTISKDQVGHMAFVDSIDPAIDNGLPPAIGKEIPIFGADHVNEGVRVTYNSTPPTSGEHWPRWADCGFYTEDIPDERIVHNLEHGNIVVSYNFANPAQVTALREVLEEIPLFEYWGVARPYDKIPEGQVALAAWGRLHFTSLVNPEEIDVFFRSLAGILGPEHVTC